MEFTQAHIHEETDCAVRTCPDYGVALKCTNLREALGKNCTLESELLCAG